MQIKIEICVFPCVVCQKKNRAALGMDQPVYIVDDDAAVRDSLRMLLESAGYPVRSYNSAQSFLGDAELDRGCLIVDIRMPGMSGLELQGELVRRRVTLPVIVITGHADVSLAVRAMGAGAVDFIEKPFDDQRMLDSVANAQQLAIQRRGQAGQAQAARNLLDLLTPREREVFDRLVKGQANKIVAHGLGISSRTVEIHRAHLMSKLQARSLSDIVRTALAADAR
jgi:two-component system response regulator FixJ